MSLVRSSSIAAVLAFGFLTSAAAVSGCSSPDTASSQELSREITGQIDLNSYDLDNPAVVAESDDGHFYAASLEADGSFSLNVPSQQAYRLLLTNSTFSGSYKAISYIEWQTDVGYTSWAYCDHGGSIGVGTVKPPPGQVSCKNCSAGKGGGGAGGSGSASGNVDVNTHADGGCGVSVSAGGDVAGDIWGKITGSGSAGGDSKGGSASGSGEASGGWSWEGSWGVSVDVDTSGCGDIDVGGGASGSGSSSGKGGGGASGSGKGGGGASGSGKGGGSVDYDAGASGSGKGGGSTSGKGGSGKGGGTCSGSCPTTPTPTPVCDDLGSKPAPPVSHCGSKAPGDVHGQSGKGGKGGSSGKGGGSASSYDAAVCTAPPPPAPPAPPVAKPGDACHVNAECGSAMFCCGNKCVSPNAKY